MSMELSKQVTSLELSKRLKELGVKQESYHTYMVWRKTGSSTLVDEWNKAFIKDPAPFDEYAAFTVAELGEMLPKYLVEGVGSRAVVYLRVSHSDSHLSQMGKWYISYERAGKEPDYRIEAESETEADARAKMLIYLLEQKLITSLT